MDNSLEYPYGSTLLPNYPEKLRQDSSPYNTGLTVAYFRIYGYFLDQIQREHLRFVKPNNKLKRRANKLLSHNNNNYFIQMLSHSTLMDFFRFLSLSTSLPRARAMR